jgi:hypothetical protein
MLNVMVRNVTLLNVLPLSAVLFYVILLNVTLRNVVLLSTPLSNVILLYVDLLNVILVNVGCRSSSFHFSECWHVRSHSAQHYFPLYMLLSIPSVAEKYNMYQNCFHYELSCHILKKN